jgi:hypothetical protein
MRSDNSDQSDQLTTSCRPSNWGEDLLPGPEDVTWGEDFTPENIGWDDEPPEPESSWTIPLALDRMGLLDIPEWARNVDGTCSYNWAIQFQRADDDPSTIKTSTTRNPDGSLKEEISKEEISKKETSKNICRHFAKKGKCKFGDKCRFSHEIVEEPPQDWELICRIRREAMEDKNGVPTKRCQLYDMAMCRRKYSCPNRHIDDDYDGWE